MFFSATGIRGMSSGDKHASGVSWTGDMSSLMEPGIKFNCIMYMTNVLCQKKIILMCCELHSKDQKEAKTDGVQLAQVRKFTHETLIQKYKFNNVLLLYNKLIKILYC